MRVRFAFTYLSLTQLITFPVFSPGCIKNRAASHECDGSIQNSFTTLSFLSHLDGKNIFHGFKVNCKLSGFGSEMKPLESLSLSSWIFCLCFVRFGHSPACGQRSGSCKSAQRISFRQLLSISHSFFFYAIERIFKSCLLLLCVLVLWLFRARLLTWESIWKWMCK